MRPFIVLILASLFSLAIFALEQPAGAAQHFPPKLESYNDAHLGSVTGILKNRIEKEPFNLIATILFGCAVVHTFLARKFMQWSHYFEERPVEKPDRFTLSQHVGVRLSPTVVSRILHFLGEIEAVFGIWVVPLVALMAWRVGFQETKDYLNLRVNFTEPIFVVVIMAIAATRPVMALAEGAMALLARRMGGSPGAWWLCILTLGPVLGSFITEPAAMTISATLLARQFYQRQPSRRLAYATLGLLFVNISIGGTLTHFAAPPVLMVASTWGWDTPFMLRHFGWIAVLGILVSNAACYLYFRGEFGALARVPQTGGEAVRSDPIPAWVTVIHLLFMGYAVFFSHYPVLLIGGFLMFVAVHQVTEDYQDRLDLRMPILVGFFLAGLVIHGTLQQWWIEPLLGKLGDTPLMLGSIGLTAFNDNAAITYLASLVPSLTDSMKISVVAGAVVGGGLTVIANAPNPAGQAILSRHFRDGIAPLHLFLGALPPTLIVGALFWLLR